MIIRLFGTKSLGQCVPSALTAQAEGLASLQAQLGEISARINALAEAQAHFTLNPPTLAGSLQTCGEILAGLAASIALGVPSIDASATANVVAEIADLTAELGSIQAKIEALVEIGVQLGAVGITIHGYRGRADRLGTAAGGEFVSGLPGGQPDDEMGSILLSTASPESLLALAAFFGVEIPEL